MTRHDWAPLYLAACAAALLVLAALGLMRPWFTPDSAGWLAPCAGIECLGQPRFPLYRGIFLAITLDGRAPALLPWAQDLAFLGAGFALARAAGAAGVSTMGALALALAFPASNMLLLWGRAEIPEILARAAVLGALAATLRCIGSGGGRAAALAGGLAGGLAALACCLDPAQLPFVVLLPLLAIWLGKPARRAGWIAAAGAVPLLLISLLRLATLGDFNIVSFGGYEMSGLAADLLSPATVPRLAADLRPTAMAILTRRKALVAAGAIPPVPRNSTGRRSLLSEEIGYYDILARHYDALIGGAVRPLRQPGESWVAFNARLQRFSFAVVRAQPLGYAAWIAGALARLVGRMLVFNLPFAMAAMVAFALALVRRWRPMPAGDGRILFAVTAVYTIGSGALACLVGFPAQRYIDGTGLLIAAWPIYAALHLAGVGEKRRMRGRALMP